MCRWFCCQSASRNARYEDRWTRLPCWNGMLPPNCTSLQPHFHPLKRRWSSGVHWFSSTLTNAFPLLEGCSEAGPRETVAAEDWILEMGLADMAGMVALLCAPVAAIRVQEQKSLCVRSVLLIDVVLSTAIIGANYFNVDVEVLF